MLAAVLIQPAGSDPGTLLSAHVTDFASISSLHAWRRRARREMSGTPGLRFAKAMASIGTARSFGFGAGLPRVRRQVMLAAWTSAEAFDAFLSGPLGAQLARDSAYDWHVLSAVVSTRGSFHGRRPLAPSAEQPDGGALGVITLGRSSARTLARFLWHGEGLAGEVRGAGGVITAVSAGVPLTGNATFSLWESREDMLRFAYGERSGGHVETVRARPPILVEQLNARLAPLRIAGRWDLGSTQNPERLARLAEQVGGAGA